MNRRIEILKTIVKTLTAVASTHVDLSTNDRTDTQARLTLVAPSYPNRISFPLNFSRAQSLTAINTRSSAPLKERKSDSTTVIPDPTQRFFAAKRATASQSWLATLSLSPSSLPPIAQLRSKLQESQQTPRSERSGESSPTTVSSGVSRRSRGSDTGVTWFERIAPEFKAAMEQAINYARGGYYHLMHFSDESFDPDGSPDLTKIKDKVLALIDGLDQAEMGCKKPLKSRDKNYPRVILNYKDKLYHLTSGLELAEIEKPPSDTLAYTAILERTKTIDPGDSIIPILDEDTTNKCKIISRETSAIPHRRSLEAYSNETPRDKLINTVKNQTHFPPELLNIVGDRIEKTSLRLSNNYTPTSTSSSFTARTVESCNFKIIRDESIAKEQIIFQMMLSPEANQIRLLHEIRENLKTEPLPKKYQIELRKFSSSLSSQPISPMYLETYIRYKLLNKYNKPLFQKTINSNLNKNQLNIILASIHISPTNYLETLIELCGPAELNQEFKSNLFQLIEKHLHNPLITRSDKGQLKLTYISFDIDKLLAIFSKAQIDKIKDTGNLTTLITNQPRIWQTLFNTMRTVETSGSLDTLKSHVSSLKEPLKSEINAALDTFPAEDTAASLPPLTSTALIVQTHPKTNTTAPFSLLKLGSLLEDIGIDLAWLKKNASVINRLLNTSVFSSTTPLLLTDIPKKKSSPKIKIIKDNVSSSQSTQTTTPLLTESPATEKEKLAKNHNQQLKKYFDKWKDLVNQKKSERKQQESAQLEQLKTEANQNLASFRRAYRVACVLNVPIDDIPKTNLSTQDLNQKIAEKKKKLADDKQKIISKIQEWAKEQKQILSESIAKTGGSTAINDAIKSLYEAEINALATKYTFEVENQFSIAMRTIDEQSLEIKSIELEIKKHSNKIRKFNTQLGQLNKYNKEIQTLITEISSELKTIRSDSHFPKTLNDKLQKLNDLLAFKKPYKDIAESLKADREGITATGEKLQEKIGAIKNKILGISITLEHPQLEDLPSSKELQEYLILQIDGLKDHLNTKLESLRRQMQSKASLARNKSASSSNKKDRDTANKADQEIEQLASKFDLIQSILNYPNSNKKQSRQTQIEYLLFLTELQDELIQEKAKATKAQVLSLTTERDEARRATAAAEQRVAAAQRAKQEAEAAANARLTAAQAATQRATEAQAAAEQSVAEAQAAARRDVETANSSAAEARRDAAAAQAAAEQSVAAAEQSVAAAEQSVAEAQAAARRDVETARRKTAEAKQRATAAQAQAALRTLKEKMNSRSTFKKPAKKSEKTEEELSSTSQFTNTNDRPTSPSATTPAASPTVSPSSPTSTFKYRLYGLTTSRSSQAANFTTISNEEIGDDLALEIAKSEGRKVYTSWHQEYQFYYNPDKQDGPTAILDHSKIIQGPVTDSLGGEHDRQELLALTIMTMIDNVICRSKELHISSPDPFVIAVANAYVAKLNSDHGLSIPTNHITCTTTSTPTSDIATTQTLVNTLCQNRFTVTSSLTDHPMIAEIKQNHLPPTSPTP